jgi:hypothetical protein
MPIGALQRIKTRSIDGGRLLLSEYNTEFLLHNLHAHHVEQMRLPMVSASYTKPLVYARETAVVVAAWLCCNALDPVGM